MASAAPLKPWQRRQGSSTLTEQLPPRLTTACTSQCRDGHQCGAAGSGMPPGVNTLTSSPVSASLTGISPAMSSTAPVALTSAGPHAVASSSCNVVGAAPSSSTTAGAAVASSAATAATASTRAQAAGIAGGTTAGALATTTPGYGTSTLGAGYGSAYGSSYGAGYGSRYGMGMGGGYGAYGGMGMGMGMNRYGGQQNRGDFFGPDTDSMGRFNEILEFNGFLLDRISDCSSNIYQRLKHILLWLFELKHHIQRSHNASISDEERQELRKKILKRMIVLGSLATIFFLWCIRSLYRRRKQKRLADWNRIFPSQSAL